MAYYTGSANSFNDLLNVLVAGCQTDGWSWSDGILSKGRAFVKPQNITTGYLPGLCLEGGTGQSGATLLNGSGPRARIGRVALNAWWPSLVWPLTYHLHINTAPDEVYLVANTQLTDYHWLSFGLSDLPLEGTGLWVAGSAHYDTGGAGHNGLISLSPDGGSWQGSGCPGLFIASNAPTAPACAVQIEADGSWPKYTAAGLASLSPLVARQNAAWNATSMLLPIQEWQVVEEGRRRLIVDTAHARRVRLDNLEPGQQLMLGPDVWRVYPYFRKNASVPNGGSRDTGTMGWALRE